MAHRLVDLRIPTTQRGSIERDASEAQRGQFELAMEELRIQLKDHVLSSAREAELLLIRVEAAESAVTAERTRSDELNQKVGELRVELAATQSELNQARSDLAELVEESRAVVPRRHLKRVTRLGTA